MMYHFVPTMKSLGGEKKAEKAEKAEAKAAAPAETAPAESAKDPIDFSKVEIEPLFQDFVDFETFLSLIHI